MNSSSPQASPGCWDKWLLPRSHPALRQVDLSCMWDLGAYGRGQPNSLKKEEKKPLQAALVSHCLALWVRGRTEWEKPDCSVAPGALLINSPGKLHVSARLGGEHLTGISSLRLLPPPPFRGIFVPYVVVLNSLVEGEVSHLAF